MTDSTPQPARPPLLHPLARALLFLIAIVTVEAMLAGVLGSFGLLGALFSFIGIFFVVAVFCRLIDRRSFSSNGLELHARAAARFATGAIIGAAMLAANLLILTVSGHMASASVSPSLSPVLAWYLAGFVIQASGEELMARGYLLQTLLTRYRSGVAIAFQLLVFVGLHLANPGVSALALINLTIFAVAMSLAYLRLGSLWLPCGLHASWNFCLSNVAGLRVSGIEVPTRIFDMHLAGPALLTGGEFGLEASFVNTLVWSAFCIIVYKMRSRCQSPLWWERARAQATAGVDAEEPRNSTGKHDIICPENNQKVMR